MELFKGTKANTSGHVIGEIESILLVQIGEQNKSKSLKKLSENFSKNFVLQVFLDLLFEIQLFN